MLIPLDGIAIIHELNIDDSGIFLAATDKSSNLVGEIVAISDKPQIGQAGYERHCSAKIGDRVVYQKYADQDYREDGQLYKLVKFEHILAIVQSGAKK